MKALAAAIRELAAALDRQTTAIEQVARVEADGVAASREQLRLERAEFERAAADASGEDQE